MSKNGVFVKGIIWTGDDEFPIADYFYAEDGYIVDVGKNSDSVPHQCSDAQVYDFTGDLIIPGFTDSHIHLTAYSKLNLYPNLTTAKSLEEFGEIVRSAVEKAEKGAWVRCINYNESNWLKPITPDIVYLDSIAPNNPVIVSRYCGHTHVVNSAGLKKAGLWDSENLNIERDSNHKLTGVINEGGAASIIEAVAKEYETPQRLKKLMNDACNKLSSLGVTAVHACDAPSYALGEDLSTMQDLENEGNLTVRVSCYHDSLPNYTFKSGYGNDKIAFAGLKLFADGSLGGHTAALCQPYSDMPSTSGQFNHSDEKLEETVTTAHNRGIQVQIHAIGDGALKQVISVLEKVIEKNGEPPIPYRINHAIVCPPELLNKLLKIGAVVDIQPVQAFTDRKMAPLRLGFERMRHAYCYKTLAHSGIMLTGSSDAPIEDPNPWVSIWAAVCRCNIDGTPLEGFNAEEKLTINEALKIYTVNPWKAIGKGNQFGMIKKGYRADFVVIDGNPLTIDKYELCNVHNKATFLDANCIWRKSS